MPKQLQKRPASPPKCSQNTSPSSGSKSTCNSRPTPKSSAPAPRASAIRPTPTLARSAWACPAPCRCSTSAPSNWPCAPRWRSICTVQNTSRFARKNYFYPDLPKGYQISMYELPLATDGWLEIEHDGARKRIGITRLHLEEDAAKNLHEGFPDSDRPKLHRLQPRRHAARRNRLRARLRSPAEAYAYLTTLKQILEYAGVSDCNMEEGSLRCDANVSVRRRGAEQFGTKAEVKNLNSFRYPPTRARIRNRAPHRRARIRRPHRQETRLWNVSRRPHRTHALQGIRARLSLFPRSRPAAGARQRRLARRNRAQHAGTARSQARRALLQRYGLSAYDAEVLTATRALGRLFRGGRQSRRARKGRRQLDADRAAAPPQRFRPARSKRAPSLRAALAELLDASNPGSITGAIGKKVFAAMFETGKSAEEIIAAEGLVANSETPARSNACAAKSSRKIPTTSPNIGPATKASSSFSSAR